MTSPLFYACIECGANKGADPGRCEGCRVRRAERLVLRAAQILEREWRTFADDRERWGTAAEREEAWAKKGRENDRMKRRIVRAVQGRWIDNDNADAIIEARRAFDAFREEWARVQGNATKPEAFFARYDELAKAIAAL